MARCPSSLPVILLRSVLLLVLAGPLLAGPFSDHPDPLVAELEQLLEGDYAGPLTHAQKLEAHAIEASLAAFASAPDSTWGDLRALLRASRRLSRAFGDDFAAQDAGVTLEHLAWDALGGLDGDLTATADGVLYRAPTLGPAAVSKVVARRAGRAVKVLAAAHGADDLLVRARRLTRAARIVERAEAHAAKSQGEIQHFVFGPALQAPVVADTTHASYQTAAGRLTLAGWATDVDGGSLGVVVIMEGVDGPGLHPMSGLRWVSAYAEQVTPEGVVRMDALEGTGSLTVHELGLDTGRLDVRFTFQAYDVTSGASLAVDHGSFRTFALQVD